MNANNLLTSVVNTYYRRWPMVLGAACVLLNGGCNIQTEDSTKPVVNTAETDLKLDRRYYDTMAVGPPYSKSAERQIAIINQLRRLESYKGALNARELDGSIGKVNKEDSVRLIEQGESVDFKNYEAWLADIHRKMDSLKVLENIPLKPYPKFKKYEN